MKGEQEEREKSHSPSMADNISYTADLASKEAKRQINKDQKQLSFLGDIKKNAREQTGILKRVNTRLRKLRGKMMDWIMLLFGAIQSFVGSGLSMLGNTISTLLGGLGLGQLGKTLFTKGKLGKFAKTPKQMSLFTRGGAATRAAQVGRVGTGARVAGVGSKVVGAGSKVVGIGGKFLGGAIAGIISLGMATYDAIGAAKEPDEFTKEFVKTRAFKKDEIQQALFLAQNPKEFAAGRITSAIGAFLAGKESGWEGTKRGVLKGSGFGMAAGMFGGPIGVAIGGAIGAIAGGILGFVGGGRITEGLEESKKNIKDLVKGVKSLVSFPFKVMKEGIKSTWVLAKFAWRMTIGKAWDAFKEWLEKPGWIQSIINFVKDKVFWVFDRIKESFNWWKDKIGEFFDKDIWKDLKKIATDVLMTVMFPLNGIVKIFKWLREKIDSTIRDIPVVGSIYAAAIKAIKGIHEGTLASDLERELGKYGKKEPPTEKAPPTEKTREETIAAKAAAIAAEKKSVSSYFKEAGIADKVVYINGELRAIKVSGKWVHLKPKEAEEKMRGWKEFIAKGEAEKEKSKNKHSETETQKIIDGLNKTASKNETATINSTKMIVSSNTNLINSQNNGGGMAPAAGSFSSAYGAASDVARCNIG